MDDFKVTWAMMQCGGGFVNSLGRLFRMADDDNQRRLKEAFPEYWAKYSEIAAERVCHNCRGINIISDGDVRQCEDCGIVCP